MKSLFVMLVVSAVSCGVVWAQATSQITGSVKDQTGAVLPGADITATQTDTGVARSSVSDETGSFVLPSLPLGPYRLEVSLPGFRTFVQTGITLQVNTNPVINAILEVGQVSEQVEVQANAVMVETRSTGIGQIMENQRILELPLNGRQVTELILLQGGTTPGYNSGANNGGNRNYATTNISISGGAATGIAYTLDGASHRDNINSQNLPLPFPDALQEFKLETSALPAQYGSAGAVNAVTKSGTNDLHGSLFEFFRDGHLNARNAFASVRDMQKRNQFGGTLGGPIMRNKLFFFVGHQATVQRSVPSSQRATIPTAEMLAGDFTNFTSPACNGGVQRTLTPAAGFQNNRIAPTAFSQAALNIIGRLPQTSNPCGEIIFSRKDSFTENVTLGRTDYQISEKQSLFSRIQINQLKTPTDFDPNNLLALTKGTTDQRVYSLAMGHTYLIGASIVNNFRATLNRSRNPREAVHFFDWQDVGVNVYVVEEDLMYNNFGGFSIGSVSNASTNFNGTNFQLAEDMSMIKGSHQIGFGGLWGWTSLNQNPTQNSVGGFTFNGSVSGINLVDFMLGRPSQFQQSGRPLQYTRNWSASAYVQDTWKVNPRLTMNYGVRWDPLLAMFEKHANTVHFDYARFSQGLRSTVYANAPAGLIFPGDPGVPDKGFHNNRYGDFSPRFGIAWDPQGDGRMTIRAAYGLFYDQPPHFFYYPVSNNAPYGNTIQLPTPAGGLANPWLNYPGGNPFPYIRNKNSAFFTNSPYASYPLDIKHTYTNQWNLSIQRQVGQDWLFAANYLGNSSIHLYTSKNLNPAIYYPGSNCTLPNGNTITGTCSTNAGANTTARRTLTIENATWGPYYSTVAEVDDGGTASYNALMLTVQRRSSNGLTVQGNYTWSHCITDQVSTNPGGATTDYNNFNRAFDRGDCTTQDRRQVANVSTVWATPAFANPTVRTILGGWQVSGILRVSTGSAIEIATGIDHALVGITTGRANQLLPDVYHEDKNAAHWFNTAAIANPAAGSWGNMGRNTLRGPGRVSIDMGLARTFRVRESQTLQFRAEAFNLPNMVNLQNPNTTMTNPNFGRITSADDPRIIQLALKYVF